MTTTKRAQNGNRNRKQLEAEADEVRDRLMDRVSELDLRRDRIVRTMQIASKPPLSIVLLATAGVAATAFVAWRIHKARRHPLERFVEAWLMPPEARRPEGVLGRTVKNALFSVAREVGRRSLDRLIAAPHGEVERPAAGHG